MMDLGVGYSNQWSLVGNCLVYRKDSIVSRAFESAGTVTAESKFGGCR